MATEKRLIELDTLINNIDYDYDLELWTLRCEPEDIPTVKAVEVVHGRWKPYHEADIGHDEYGVRCSNCGFEVEDHEVKFIMHYCPNCGAKMDGGSDETD